MNVADFLFTYFTNRGVRNVFLVTGGHSMYLNDAVAKNSLLTYVCTHHEQAATMAAEAYGRLASVPAIALVTAGPGSVNALNGVVGAWVDSSPMIVISGQSNLPIVQYQESSGIRQFGVQGISVRKMVEPITKYFVTVDSPDRVGEYASRAWEALTTGRPGPVWLEVPLDMQRAIVSDAIVEQYLPVTTSSIPTQPTKDLSEMVKQAYDMIAAAERPLWIFGQGVRLSGGLDAFASVIERIRIPLLTSRLGLDMIESDHPLYIGRPGTYGERSANFAVQNADLIIAVGSRLTVSLTGHNIKDFGRNAKKIVVDIDQKELDKPDLNITYPILADAKVFLESLAAYARTQTPVQKPEWLAVCKNWRQKYPVALPEYKNEKPVNSYYFVDALTEAAPEDAYIVVDTGSCFHVAAQTWKIKKGQRFHTTGGISTMGYWVAAIGACMANDRRDTIVITGDGSMQMNLQELATVSGNKLPLKIFIFNNNGYLLMRHTQRNFFDSRMIGESPSSGVWCPDILEVARAYHIPAVRISSVEDVDAKIRDVLATPGPVICDVMTPEWQLIIPRVTSEKGADGRLVSRPYEDMFPFLPPEELSANMIVKSPLV